MTESEEGKFSGNYDDNDGESRNEENEEKDLNNSKSDLSGFGEGTNNEDMLSFRGDFSGEDGEEGKDKTLNWDEILSDISLEYDENLIKRTYRTISYQVAYYYHSLIQRGIPEERAFPMAMELSSQLIAITLY